MPEGTGLIIVFADHQLRFNNELDKYWMSCMLKERVHRKIQILSTAEDMSIVKWPYHTHEQ